MTRLQWIHVWCICYWRSDKTSMNTCMMYPLLTEWQDFNEYMYDVSVTDGVTRLQWIHVWCICHWRSDKTSMNTCMMYLLLTEWQDFNEYMYDVSVIDRVVRTRQCYLLEWKKRDIVSRPMFTFSGINHLQMKSPNFVMVSSVNYLWTCTDKATSENKKIHDKSHT